VGACVERVSVALREVYLEVVTRVKFTWKLCLHHQRAGTRVYARVQSHVQIAARTHAFTAIR
jgi:hypothetical protein